MIMMSHCLHHWKINALSHLMICQSVSLVITVNTWGWRSNASSPNEVNRNECFIYLLYLKHVSPKWSNTHSAQYVSKVIIAPSFNVTVSWPEDWQTACSGNSITWQYKICKQMLGKPLIIPHLYSWWSRCENINSMTISTLHSPRWLRKWWVPHQCIGIESSVFKFPDGFQFCKKCGCLGTVTWKCG